MPAVTAWGQPGYLENTMDWYNLVVHVCYYFQMSETSNKTLMGNRFIFGFVYAGSRCSFLPGEGYADCGAQDEMPSQRVRLNNKQD